MSPETRAIRTISKLGPWLAPVPSAYFVGRSSIEHLALPLAIACISAAVIEIMGVVSVYSILAMYAYNLTRPKSKPPAPTWLAVSLCGVYLATAISITVLLEVYPRMATYAVALFPLLSLEGALNLVLILLQEKREADAVREKQERRELRLSRTQAQTLPDTPSRSLLDTEHPFEQRQTALVQLPEPAGREAGHSNGQVNRRQAILDMLNRNGHTGISEIAKTLGVSRTTVYADLSSLIEQGMVAKDDGRYAVKS